MAIELEEREALRGHGHEEGLQDRAEAAQHHVAVHAQLGHEPKT